jgi:PPOX class probable F420-dependent enzyme
VDPSGQPHLIPISFAVMGDVVYSAVDSKPKLTRRLQRLANIELEPRTTLLIDHYDEDWTRVWWCMLRGRARVVSEGEEFERAVEALVEKYEQYEGKPPAGPAVVVDVESWRGWYST